MNGVWDVDVMNINIFVKLVVFIDGVIFIFFILEV